MLGRPRDCGILALLFLNLFFFGRGVCAADIERGKVLYQRCSKCHGLVGEGRFEQKTPRIAGQFDWYLISSLKAFKARKERTSPEMWPFIRHLSDRDMEDLAAYIAGLRPL